MKKHWSEKVDFVKSVYAGLIVAVVIFAADVFRQLVVMLITLEQDWVWSISTVLTALLLWGISVIVKRKVKS